MSLPTGMVTFLFTDVVGSSALWEKARNAMARSVHIHDELLERAIVENDGHVVKRLGDGFMAVFEDPADAVQASVAGQVLLESQTWQAPVDRLAVRMGGHTGPAELADGDYHGSTVNRAARLEGAGHGGQIIVSSATRELVADRISDIDFLNLGEHHLRGMERPERVYQVRADGLRVDFPPLRTESTPTNLPARIQPIVGREEDVADLVRAIGEHRLVTVTGAGGAGKTTLAYQAARLLAGEFPAGIWQVELAGLTDGARVAPEILGAIRRPAPPDRDPVDTLVGALSGQQLLLVLDNCEHLRSDVAELVTTLLSSVPEPQVVATSREPLRVVGETVWQITPLSLPEAPTVEAVSRSGAGKMFIAFAEAADQRFSLSESSAEAVQSICTRLDGLPLALELAAARIRSIDVGTLDQRIADSHRLLRADTVGTAPHHRTLHDTIQWSYELLDEASQRLLRRLSVFAGGFDLNAAEVVGGFGDDADEVIDLIDQLVAQSLVTHHEGRYQMLETIRQFAASLLEGADEARDTRTTHLEWLTELARKGGRELEGRHQLEWMRRFNAEIDNIRAGFGWALQTDPVQGATAAGALTRFFWMNAAEADATKLTDSRSFLAEGYDWSTRLLEAAGDDLEPKVRARLQLGIGGMLCVRAGRYEEAIERLSEASEISRSEGNMRSVAWARFYDGIAGWGIRGIEETIELFRNSLAGHAEAEDRGGELFSTLLLAAALGYGGHLEEGRPYMEKFDTAAKSLNVPNLVAHADDFFALYDAIEDVTTPETTERAARALARFRSINNYACLTHALGGASMVLTRSGAPELAGTVIGLSHGIRERLNMVVAPYEDRTEMSARLFSEVMKGREEDDDLWQRTLVEGRTMEPDEGVDWTIRQLGHDPDLLT